MGKARMEAEAAIAKAEGKVNLWDNITKAVDKAKNEVEKAQ